jgi:hypothetical protein
MINGITLLWIRKISCGNFFKIRIKMFFEFDPQFLSDIDSKINTYIFQAFDLQKLMLPISDIDTA